MADLQLSVGKGINCRATGGGPGISRLAGSWRAGWLRRGRGAGCDGAGVWRRGHMMWLGACASVLLIPAAGALAQRGGAPEVRIDPAAALQTFSDVTQWLDEWETPTDAALPEGCVGVWAGVRLGGRLMGSGWSLDATKLDDPGTRALTGAVRRAMSTSYETAGGVDDPDIRTDKREAFLASPFRTLELELAHSPNRIRATSLDRVLENIRPGLDGLLMRRGGSSYAVFPAEMLAFDTRASSAMVSLLSECGVSMDAVDLEIGNGTIRMWSFETVHLAQATRQGPASFLRRGSRAVPLESIDVAEIRLMSNSLAAYLMRSTSPYPDDSGYLLLLGDYSPHADRRLQNNASASEHALAALALLKYSAGSATPGELAAAARTTAVRLLSPLAEDEAVRLVASQDARTAALVVLAIRELKSSELTGELSQLAISVREGVERAFRTDRGFAPDLSPEDRALVAAALGTRESIDAAWLSVGVEMQPLLMPWLSLAEVSLSEGRKAIPSRAALRNLRDRLLADQPGREPGQSVEADVIGALRYRPNREADWQAAHLVAFSALMLGSPMCTEESERAARIIDLQRSLRFLRQLQVREADRYRVRNADFAMGGMRSAVIDQTMPTAASAMALLATTSTLEAFEALAGGGR